MATPQSGSCRWIGKDPGVAFSQKIEVTRRGESEESPSLSSLHSLVLSLFLLHILDLVVFLLCFLFCFGKISFFASFQWKTVVLVGLICLLFSFFSLQIHEEEKKLAASLYQWKTVVPLVAPLSRHFGYSSERLEGFSLFKVQIFLPFCFFSCFFLSFALLASSLLKDNGYWVVRCRLLHGIASFKDFLQSLSQSLLFSLLLILLDSLETSWMCERPG